MAEETRWQILLERAAEKAMRRLPKDVLRRLDRAILALADDPRPPGCKKLAGYENLYRIRVGDWRISYAIEDDKLIVIIVEVAPRGRAYRNL
jgi:mRNA interferase RelE/StbE